jgi:hypothetical protein
VEALAGAQDRGEPAARLARRQASSSKLIATTMSSGHRACTSGLVRLARDAGDPERAEQAASAVEAIAARNPDVATPVGAALRCRGLLEDSPEVLLRAVDACRAGAPATGDRARL